MTQRPTLGTTPMFRSSIAKYINDSVIRLSNSMNELDDLESDEEKQTKESKNIEAEATTSKLDESETKEAETEYMEDEIKNKKYNFEKESKYKNEYRDEGSHHVGNVDQEGIEMESNHPLKQQNVGKQPKYSLEDNSNWNVDESDNKLDKFMDKKNESMDIQSNNNSFVKPDDNTDKFVDNEHEIGHERVSNSIDRLSNQIQNTSCDISKDDSELSSKEVTIASTLTTETQEQSDNPEHILVESKQYDSPPVTKSLKNYTVPDSSQIHFHFEPLQNSGLNENKQHDHSPEFGNTSMNIEILGNQEGVFERGESNILDLSSKTYQENDTNIASDEVKAIEDSNAVEKKENYAKVIIEKIPTLLFGEEIEQCPENKNLLLETQDENCDTSPTTVNNLKNENVNTIFSTPDILGSHEKKVEEGSNKSMQTDEIDLSLQESSIIESYIDAIENIGATSKNLRAQASNFDDVNLVLSLYEQELKSWSTIHKRIRSKFHSLCEDNPTIALEIQDLSDIFNALPQKLDYFMNIEKLRQSRELRMRQEIHQLQSQVKAQQLQISKMNSEKQFQNHESEHYIQEFKPTTESKEKEHFEYTTMKNTYEKKIHELKKALDVQMLKKKKKQKKMIEILIPKHGAKKSKVKAYQTPSLDLHAISPPASPKHSQPVPTIQLRGLSKKQKVEVEEKISVLTYRFTKQVEAHEKRYNNLKEKFKALQKLYEKAHIQNQERINYVRESMRKRFEAEIHKLKEEMENFYEDQIDIFQAQHQNEVLDLRQKLRRFQIESEQEKTGIRFKQVLLDQELKRRTLQLIRMQKLASSYASNLNQLAKSLRLTLDNHSHQKSSKGDFETSKAYHNDLYSIKLRDNLKKIDQIAHLLESSRKQLEMEMEDTVTNVSEWYFTQNHPSNSDSCTEVKNRPHSAHIPRRMQSSALSYDSETEQPLHNKHQSSTDFQATEIPLASEPLHHSSNQPNYHEGEDDISYIEQAIHLRKTALIDALYNSTSIADSSSIHNCSKHDSPRVSRSNTSNDSHMMSDSLTNTSYSELYSARKQNLSYDEYEEIYDEVYEE